MKAHINRRKFVVYEPNFKTGGKIKTLYSWNQTKKLCKKWGAGCEIHVNRLFGGTRRGGLSFWNNEMVLDWV